MLMSKAGDVEGKLVVDISYILIERLLQVDLSVVRGAFASDTKPGGELLECFTEPNVGDLFGGNPCDLRCADREGALKGFVEVIVRFEAAWAPVKCFEARSKVTDRQW